MVGGRGWGEPLSPRTVDKMALTSVLKQKLTLIHCGAVAAALMSVSIVALDGAWSSISMSLRNVMAISYWRVSAHSCATAGVANTRVKREPRELRS